MDHSKSLLIIVGASLTTYILYKLLVFKRRETCNLVIETKAISKERTNAKLELRTFQCYFMLKSNKSSPYNIKKIEMDTMTRIYTNINMNVTIHQLINGFNSVEIAGKDNDINRAMEKLNILRLNLFINHINIKKEVFKKISMNSNLGQLIYDKSNCVALIEYEDEKTTASGHILPKVVGFTEYASICLIGTSTDLEKANKFLISLQVREIRLKSTRHLNSFKNNSNNSIPQVPDIGNCNEDSINSKTTPVASTNSGFEVSRYFIIILSVGKINTNLSSFESETQDPASIKSLNFGATSSYLLSQIRFPTESSDSRRASRLSEGTLLNTEKEQKKEINKSSNVSNKINLKTSDLSNLKRNKLKKKKSGNSFEQQRRAIIAKAIKNKSSEKNTQSN